MWRVTFLSFYLTTVTALLLPGPCPYIPPTNGSITTISQVLVLIPFEETETLMFKMHVKAILSCIMITRQDSTSSLEISHTNSSIYYQRSKMTRTDNNSYELTTGIYGRSHNSSCVPEVTEFVQIWSHGNFGFFYSCQEIGETHDVGLIVSTEFYKRLYNSDIKRLLSTVTLYFEQRIVDEVKSRSENPNPHCDAVYLFLCEALQIDYAVLKIIILVMIASLCMLWLVIRIIFKKNQVYPI